MNAEYDGDNIQYDQENTSVTREILELNKAQIKIIVFLYNVKVAIYNEITELLHTNRKPYVDSVLKDLEKRNIIRERRAGKKKHVRIFYLTEKGEKLGDILLKIYRFI